MKEEILVKKIQDKFGARIQFNKFIDKKNIECHCNIHNVDFKIGIDYIFREKCKDACPQCHGLYNTEIARNKISKKYNQEIILKSEWTTETTIFSELIFNCKYHGEFKSVFNNMLHYKYGCPLCASKNRNDDKSKKPIEKLKEILKKFEITFNEKEFENVNYPLKFYKNGELIFIKRPGKILYSSNPEGVVEKDINSKGENFLKKFLEAENIKFEMQKTFPDLKNKNLLKIDFFLSEYNCAIEYNGSQHEDPNSIYFDLEQIKRDTIKENYILNNNMRFIKIKKKNNHDITKKASTKLKTEILNFLNSSTTSKTIEI